MEAETTIKPTLMNYKFLNIDEEEKKKKPPIQALDSNQIVAAYSELQRFKRCGGNLIYGDGEADIRVIGRPEDFSGFLKTRFGVGWRGGEDFYGHALTRLEEFFYHLLNGSPQFALITRYPHYPSLPDVHYFPWEPDESVDAYWFDSILGHIFNNTKSELDAVLLKAMFMCPMAGTTDVPAWFVTGPDRNIGKSKLIDAISNLTAPVISITKWVPAIPNWRDS